MQQTLAARARRQRRAKGLVLGYLTLHPCQDCGEDDLVVLEFDHLGPKRGDLARLVADGLSTRALRAEIEGCQVVCANCHRRRTARRAGWRRADPKWRERRLARPARERRNLDYAYEVLERSGCVDCGTHDLCVLDFDHIGERTRGVLQLARGGYGLPRLEAEIANCEVRCANCHRRRTATERGYWRAVTT